MHACTSLMLSCIIRFLDTTLSHTPVLECDSSEQISNSGIGVASNIKEAKQPVIVETTVAETRGSQQVTAVTGQMPVNKTKTVGKAKSQAGNGNELNESDDGHTISGSAEQTSNRVVVVENEIEQIKQAVVHDTESVQKSSASPEKTIADDQNSIGKVHEDGETGSMDIDSTAQVPNKSLLINNPDFSHDKDVSGVSTSPLKTTVGDQRGGTSNEQSGINYGNDERAGKLTNNSDPGTEEDKPSLQKLNEVVDTFDEFVEEIITAGTRNVDHEQRTTQLVQQSEEKKESEKGKSEEKGGNDKLKIENKGQRNNSGISDVNGEGSKVDKMVGENLKTTTAGNDQPIAKENSKNNKADESSETRIATRSTPDEKVETSKPQQSGVVQVCPLVKIPYVHSIL